MSFESTRNISIRIKCNVIVSIKDHSKKETNKTECSRRDIKEPFAIAAALFTPKKTHENNTSAKENESSHNRKNF